jgi:argonaute-like protein implicated in RNA metabolism and viral defense
MMDFTRNIIPHYSREVGEGVWQITLQPHGQREIVLPTKGKLVEVYDAAAEYINKNFPNGRMA